MNDAEFRDTDGFHRLEQNVQVLSPDNKLDPSDV